MMNEFQGGVTVLMPVYNCQEYVEASIRSVLNQSYGDFEFLIIDDGSTDRSAEIIESFNDSRINFLKKEHTGLADTLNAGLRLARGNWIARIDADDIAVKDRLKLQAEYLSSNPLVDVVSGCSVYFSGNGNVEFTVNPPSDDYTIKQILDIHNPINHSAVTYRKNKILNGRGYKVEMDCFEDFELWLRLRGRLYFHILPEILVYTRLREDSMSAKGDRTKLYNVLLEYYSRLLNSSSDKSYLKEVKFKIEYFYGSKSEARKTVPPLNTPARIAAYLSTLLPDKGFNLLKDSRLRYRLELSGKEKLKLEKELEEYLRKE